MKNKHSSIIFFILFLNILASCAQRQCIWESIVGQTFEEIEETHHSYLQTVKGSIEEAKSNIIYSYKNVINGFSAFLTPEEAEAISEMDEVISVFHSHPTKVKPHTTRSWDFTNLLEANWDPASVNGDDLLRKASYGKDVIVGVMDTGVWPESASYNDDGMEPIPESWKGICEDGVDFNSSHCNRKLIGARYYLKSYEMNYGQLDPNLNVRSARDVDGHGTHTSSTVGGRRVPNAAALGNLGYGTASGGAPLVRLAIYKVCWPIPSETSTGAQTCLPDDILAAFDDAIKDGVHVISISIGGTTGLPYIMDTTAIGALHAVRKNIVVAASAGNSGPTASSVTNIAPWIITVGASSIDRVFSSPVVLGDGTIVEGQSVTPFQKGTYPLVYAGDVEIPGTTTNLTTGLCSNGTLSPSLVRRKAVFCMQGDTYQAREVQRAGGIATVMGNFYDGIGVIGRPYLIPGTVVFSNQTSSILNYIQTNQAPTATLIPPRVLLGTKPAPFTAHFTSVGPNFIEPNILKPDITAPGLNIVAAWSEKAPPLSVPEDHRVTKFNIQSGTSMACPHVAAAAALIKAVHPDWSSAAIRSSLMTTAKLKNNVGKRMTDSSGNPATPFKYGAGHIQPSKAADPGLIYDATYKNYLLLFCVNATSKMKKHYKCPKGVPSASNLNYPSLTIGDVKGTMTIKRKVTNVGPGNSSYSVTVHPPPGYLVQISPANLYFSVKGKKKSFKITVQAESSARKNVYSFGRYIWSDGIHQVQSPITLSTR